MYIQRECNENGIVGKCNELRYEIFNPIYAADINKNFKTNASVSIEMYDGGDSYAGGSDVYLVEIFEGEEDTEIRGNGKSYHKVELEDDGLWHYYKEGEEKFTAETHLEFEDKFDEYNEESNGYSGMYE